jgi:hypothetical protein
LTLEEEGEAAAAEEAPLALQEEQEEVEAVESAAVEEVMRGEAEEAEAVESAAAEEAMRGEAEEAEAVESAAAEEAMRDEAEEVEVVESAAAAPQYVTFSRNVSTTLVECFAKSFGKPYMVSDGLCLLLRAMGGFTAPAAGHQTSRCLSLAIDRTAPGTSGPSEST